MQRTGDRMFFIYAKKRTWTGQILYGLYSSYDCTIEWLTYRQLVKLQEGTSGFVSGAYKDKKGKWVFPIMT